MSPDRRRPSSTSVRIQAAIRAASTAGESFASVPCGSVSLAIAADAAPGSSLTGSSRSKAGASGSGAAGNLVGNTEFANAQRRGTERKFAVSGSTAPPHAVMRLRTVL